MPRRGIYEAAARRARADPVPPYHELNGDWFWWGGRRGERGTMQMYRMIFDRLVNVHKLNNLIWVWNVDRPEREDRQFVDYFPGQKYVDVLALDTYEGYKQSYYDDLNALSDSKPLAVSECGANVPPLMLFAQQPKWSYYMIWAGFLRAAGSRGRKRGGAAPRTMEVVDIPALVKNPRMFKLGDVSFLEAIRPIRAASNLPEAPPVALPGR